jgi:tryptophan-rich sensory protein
MDWIVFLVFLATCFAAGSTGAFFSPGEWYRQLDKPSWTPPDWMFPVVWTSLYVIISIAAARVAGLPGSALAMAFWGLQIALNTLWSPVFFGLKQLRTAMIVLCGLWVAVAGTLVAFWSLDTLAGLLILPYLTWVTIAGALNYSLLQRNGNGAPQPAE